MSGFNYYNVHFEEAPESRDLLIKGEIENRSATHYSAVAIRIVLFIKNTAIANTVLVVNNLGPGATKVFEKHIEELEYNKVSKEISHYEICTESAY